MSLPVTITHEPPTPPCLHLTGCPVSINAATGEIELLLELHAGARFVVCFTRQQAEQVSDQLLQAAVARAAATVGGAS